MESFIKQLTDNLKQAFGDAMGDVCIITPNRRASLYIRKYLSEGRQKLFWMPGIFTLDEFIQNQSGLIVPDSIQLITEFYKVLCDTKGPDAESFDDFYSWGPEALNEFNDIDLAMADAKKLFNHLTEAKAVELWHPDVPVLTENEKLFLQRFKSLHQYYTLLREKLFSESKAFSGMMFRYAAENFDEVFGGSSFSHHVFAGFNALTPSEKKIFQSFKATSKASFYWDADDYYLNDKLHEAGRFLREHKQWCNPFMFVSEFYRESAKTINIIGTPRRIGQSAHIGRVLTGIPAEELSETCVVLAAEELLLPVLHSIPESVGSFNVTMQYPLKLSLASTLINNVFEMHRKSRQLSAARGRFYHRSLKELFNNPWIQYLIKKTDEDINESHQVFDNIFVASGEIREYLQINNPGVEQLLMPLFDANADPTELLKSILLVLMHLRAEMDTSDSESEVMSEAGKQIQKLLTSLQDNELKPGLDTLRKLLDKLFATAGASFYGEPLQGLQLMGMLETRTLDFKNVIIAGVNENALPSAKSIGGIIPFDIRKHYGLTTYHDRDAIFAYHFYRLLQRAKNVWLIYNTSSDLMGEGERSRFADQIAYELPLYNADTIIKESVIALPPEPDQLKPNKIAFENTPELTEKLVAYSSSQGLSPSALQIYASCSLRFYFRYAEGLRPEEEIEEEPDAKGIGNIIHKALEEIYKPFVNKEIRADALEKALDQLPGLCEQTFRYFYPQLSPESGLSLIWLNISKKLLENFLKDEIKNINELYAKGLSVWLMSLEETLSGTITTSQGHKVLIRGKADRIDQIGPILRILDYKTGRVKNYKLPDLNLFLANADYNIPSQLAIYAWLAAVGGRYKNYKLTAACASMRNYSKQITNIRFLETDYFDDELFDAVEEKLTKFISDIFDHNKAFTQTDDSGYCEFCDFRSICNR